MLTCMIVISITLDHGLSPSWSSWNARILQWHYAQILFRHSSKILMYHLIQMLTCIIKTKSIRAASQNQNYLSCKLLWLVHTSLSQKLDCDLLISYLCRLNSKYELHLGNSSRRKMSLRKKNIRVSNIKSIQNKINVKWETCLLIMAWTEKEQIKVAIFPYLISTQFFTSLAPILSTQDNNDISDNNRTQN